ncbi:GTPase [Euzebya tangerina]|uniref:GTPase n=1 Tax=Euzebya tangerina TaxID=591198 RepID=UPI000E32346E|nr:GTPase [Euzebya tangerina]
MSTSIGRRLDALEDAATLIRRHDLGGSAAADDTDALIARARTRIRHGTDHTVVALVGSTGSGKSSLLNALAEQEVARTSVTRPTTSVTQGVTFGLPADGLLDSIGVSRRHHLAEVPDHLSGLVLLDLPDFDSVQRDHRLEVDRLIRLVDLMIWVTDPQKYADDALHRQYLQPLSTHAEVMQVVLNKTDTLTDEQLAACHAHLDQLLDEDGLADLSPVPASTVTQGGVEEVRGILAAEVTAKEVALQRISADIDGEAARLAALADRSGASEASQSTRIVDGLATAAGVDIIAGVIAAQYQRDAVLSTGWPPLRFVRRIRRSPVGRLETTAENPVAGAEVSRTLRQAGAAIESHVGSAWGQAAQLDLREKIQPVTQALDTRISRRVQAMRQPPPWWRAVSGLQTALIGVAVIGLFWLVGLALAESLLLIDVAEFTPRIRGVAVPTALLLGGGVLGLVVATLSRLLASVLGRRHARTAVKRLRDDVAAVAHEHVIAPLETLLADAEQLDELLDVARSRVG